MKLMYFLILLSFSTAFADQGLDQLKQSFSGSISAATQELDKAALMKPVVIARGKEITQQECEEVKTKIRANYKIDPFEIVYEDGATYNAMCGGQNGVLNNFIQRTQGASNQDLSYSFVIQLEGFDYSRDVISNYFVDSDYKIVEIQQLSNHKRTGELLEYDITSIDPAGNVYFSEFAKNFSIVNKDVEGTQTIEKFISADGLIPYPVLRNTVKHSSDRTKDYQILLFERSDKKDWDEFFLPITHAWSGGFYGYSGKYRRESRHRSYLAIKYRGGSEHCAYGNIKEDQQWSRFPVDNTAYYHCVNY